jgi:hypothetical protein
MCMLVLRWDLQPRVTADISSSCARPSSQHGRLISIVFVQNNGTKRLCIMRCVKFDKSQRALCKPMRLLPLGKRHLLRDEATSTCNWWFGESFCISAYWGLKELVSVGCLGKSSDIEKALSVTHVSVISGASTG